MSLTHPLHELLPVFVDNASRKTDLPETDVLVHLLGVLSIEGAPSTAHLKQQNAQ